MRRLAILPLLLGLATAPAFADDAKRLALAKDLVAQVHTDESVRSALPLLLAQMRTTLAQQGRKDEESESYLRRYQARLSAEIGRYSDLMAEAYAAAFTEEDLSGLLAFDESPLGKKFIAERPELTQASVLAMQTVSKQVAREVAEEMAREKTQGDAGRKM